MIKIPKNTKLEKRIEELEKIVAQNAKNNAVLRKELPQMIRNSIADVLIEEKLKRMSPDKQDYIKNLLKDEDFISLKVIRDVFKNSTTRASIESYFTMIGLLKIPSIGKIQSYWANTLKNPELNIAMLVNTYNSMSTVKEEQLRDPRNVKGGLKRCNLFSQLQMNGVKKTEALQLVTMLRNAFIKNGEPNRIDKEFFKHS